MAADHARDIRQASCPFDVLEGDLFPDAVAAYNEEQHLTPAASLAIADRDTADREAVSYRMDADDLDAPIRYRAQVYPLDSVNFDTEDMSHGRVLEVEPVGHRRMPMKLRAVLDHVEELTAPDQAIPGDDGYAFVFKRNGR